MKELILLAVLKLIRKAITKERVMGIVEESYLRAKIREDERNEKDVADIARSGDTA